jgi:flagellar protein FliO/FliZ
MEKLRLLFSTLIIALLFNVTPSAERDTLPQSQPIVSAEKWEKLQNAMTGSVADTAATNKVTYKSMDSGRIMILTLKIMFYLAIIIALLYIGLKAFKKKMMGGSGSNRGSGRYLEVLENKLIGSQKHVTLVKVGNRILVLGVAEGGVNLLSQIDNPEEIKILLSGNSQNENGVTGSFSETIDAFLSRFKKDGRGVPLSTFRKDFDGME